MTGKNFDFQKIIILVLNVLELRPWSGFKEEARVPGPSHINYSHSV